MGLSHRVHVSDPPAKREDLLDAVAASVALVWQVARCLLEDKNHAAGTYWQGGVSLRCHPPVSAVRISKTKARYLIAHIKANLLSILVSLSRAKMTTD